MKNWLQGEEKKILSKWLKQQPNFVYDKAKVKERLMHSVRTAPLEEPKFSWLTMPNWGLVLTAMVIMIGSATFAYADQAKPGDVLFPVNKLNDRLILSLPFTAQTKARIQAQIVTKRLDALDQINQFAEKPTPRFENKKLQTIKESDKSLTTAIERVTENKKAFEEAGNLAGAEAMRKTLTQLETLAGQQAERVESLESKTEDKVRKEEIRQHLAEIKKARKKAGDALKIRIELEKLENSN